MRRYGRQLAVERLERAVPPTESSGGAAALLSSGAFKGVGPKLAAALTTAFGDEVIGMIQSGDERLLAVPGVLKQLLPVGQKSDSARRCGRKKLSP